VLTLLIRLVQDIDRGVEGVVETLGQTARNTGESFLIADTAGQVDAVLAEGPEPPPVPYPGSLGLWQEGGAPLMSTLLVAFSLLDVILWSACCSST